MLQQECLYWKLAHFWNIFCLFRFLQASLCIKECQLKGSKLEVPTLKQWVNQARLGASGAAMPVWNAIRLWMKFHFMLTCGTHRDVDVCFLSLEILFRTLCFQCSYFQQLSGLNNLLTLILTVSRSPPAPSETTPGLGLLTCLRGHVTLCAAAQPRLRSQGGSSLLAQWTESEAMK